MAYGKPLWTTPRWPVLRTAPHRVHMESRELREGWSRSLKLKNSEKLLLFIFIYTHILSYIGIYHSFHHPQLHNYSVTFYSSHILYTIHIVTYFIQHLVSQWKSWENYLTRSRDKVSWRSVGPPKFKAFSNNSTVLGEPQKNPLIDLIQNETRFQNFL